MRCELVFIYCCLLNGLKTEGVSLKPKYIDKLGSADKKKRNIQLGAIMPKVQKSAYQKQNSKRLDVLFLTWPDGR